MITNSHQVFPIRSAGRILQRGKKKSSPLPRCSPYRAGGQGDRPRVGFGAVCLPATPVGYRGGPSLAGAPDWGTERGVPENLRVSAG
ncbi:hypothetical protein PPACK8108_LOCUS14830 [Phakopsora pachyrhizi]|uniref:Uncharacterized protein n=1 Tax=Phakopsora pachyrhizi TaxID=170000 RepID=A0AAV0B7M1_PHAPC|nr:hypothetical protein PPACK8108_LOCUS14830 [Phakopsora pachyrhizi]